MLQVKSSLGAFVFFLLKNDGVLTFDAGARDRDTMDIWTRHFIAVSVRALVTTMSDIDLDVSQFNSSGYKTFVSSSLHTGAASRSYDRSHLASQSRIHRHDLPNLLDRFGRRGRP